MVCFVGKEPTFGKFGPPSQAAKIIAELQMGDRGMGE
jgi:hypothetical protein